MDISHPTDDLTILNLVDEGICACDLQGRITFWNPACEALYGYSRAEALGRNIRQVVNCDRDGPLDTIFAAIEKNGRWQGEFRRKSATGEEIVIDARWAARRDGEGRPIGYIETGRDVTERSRAVEELARSEAKYRTLFEHMPLPLLYTDSRDLLPLFRALREHGVEDLGAYLDANPALLGDLIDAFTICLVNQPMIALLGGAREADITGSIRPFLKTSPGTIRRSLEARFRGEKGHVEETQIDRLNGRPVDVVYSVAFADPEDPDALSQVAAIDISSRVQAEDMLRKVQADFAHAARVATLGELTASIAHEVNQPLAAIVTNGEASLRWLARGKPDLDEVRGLAGRMVADARRAADVITRIRAMATGKAPQHRPICLNEAAGDAAALLRQELLSRGVAARIELAPGLPAILADWTQLQQVFVNLLVNAMQAVVQHGTVDPVVTLRTARAPEGGVLVEIDDNGPGIPADQVAHLFDSFFTTKEGGLGIGLSICRSIVEAHGGRIGCANLSPGARFSFTLPASEARPEG